MKQIITLLLFLSCGSALAEFGVSAGASFNFKADFQTAAQPQGFANDAGADAAGAGADHIYDDGYNRVDSSDNAGNLTTYWGYDNASQDHGGSITMNSAQTILDAQSSSGEQNDAQPALELYWQTDLTTNERWNIGIRAALRWQRVDLDSRAVYSSTVETISDTYAYAGIVPGASFDGSFAGPNFLLSDDPSRSITFADGASFAASRTLEADLFAFDLGPTLSFDFTEKLRLTGSIGGTVAWIDSEFNYSDERFSEGKDSKQDWLFGAYASADLSYQIGEHWGLFGGAAYTRLQDFDQQVDGRSTELQFGDSYTLRAGLFFR